MVELWFYSGRLGNCMFMYAFTRILADALGVKASIPRGMDPPQFPQIFEDAKGTVVHTEKYNVGHDLINPRTVMSDNDNMVWFVEKNFTGGKAEGYKDQITINKILSTPDIYKKWLVILGNFELGENYYPYRNKLKQWFKFPEIDMSKIEFFKLHPELGNTNWFSRVDFPGITPDDLVISLRLEDYTSPENLNRLLTYDYFRIILESRTFNRIYIITNPGSIGHNNQYEYLKEFLPYDPIFVRIHQEYVMSMAFGAQFNHIAISQSTYSWWVAFLSNASTIYYPIAEKGPFSLVDPTFSICDLRVPCSEFLYVDYKTRTILPKDYYTKIDYENLSWKP